MTAFSIGIEIYGHVISDDVVIVEIGMEIESNRSHEDGGEGGEGGRQSVCCLFLPESEEILL